MLGACILATNITFEFVYCGIEFVPRNVFEIEIRLNSITDDDDRYLFVFKCLLLVWRCDGVLFPDAIASEFN